METNSPEALQLAGRLQEAVDAYEAALRATPNDARLLGNYGGLLNELCQFAEAERVLTLAVGLDPGAWGAWSNLGNTLVDTGRYDDAICAIGNCLRLNPDHGPALSNMGVALKSRGDVSNSIRFLEMAARIEPQNAETRCNLAQSLLAAGDYARGFAEYEWRWRTQAMRPHQWPMPRWRGECLAGRTLLLHEEGGFGDTLQFIRFARLAKARGGRVILLVRRVLASLLSRLDCLDEVIDDGAAVPQADFECPLLSLPAALQITIDRIPSADGYLTADPLLAAQWRECLDGDGASLRVGLVWAGSPRHGFRGAALADQRRSMTLAALARLGRSEATFYSLQIGEAAREAASAPPGMRLVDWTHRIGNFGDTAAFVSNLDLVIAVDTSTAHLAGALGRPVWMLSRFDQCWRWLAGRDDTPWYSTMRIYRQTAPGDWNTPLQRIFEDVEREARKARGSAPRPVGA